MSRKTGARARVGGAHAARFQAYIDDLENNQAPAVPLHGRHASGTLSSSGMHPCGKALDVCQMRRGVVDSRCHLPARRRLRRLLTPWPVEGGRCAIRTMVTSSSGVTAEIAVTGELAFVRRHMAPETRREAAVAAFE